MGGLALCPCQPEPVSLTGRPCIPGMCLYCVTGLPLLAKAQAPQPVGQGSYPTPPMTMKSYLSQPVMLTPQAVCRAACTGMWTRI